jgi:hypothetical protein
VPHYEIIFEDGSYSVANYKDDEEALSATQAHHDRALEGGPALLSDVDNRVKATRIVKLIKYDAPPGDMFEGQTLPEDQVTSELKGLIASATSDGVTDLRVLAASIRDLSNPLVDSAPHESNYKAEGKEVALPWQS